MDPHPAEHQGHASPVQGVAAPLSADLDRLARELTDILTFAGSFGLFFTCFLIFCRFIPVIAIAEVKGVIGTPATAAARAPAGTGEPMPALVGTEA